MAKHQKATWKQQVVDEATRQRLTSTDRSRTFPSTSWSASISSSSVRRIQDTSIGAIYDVIRKVDREVARLATEVLQRSPKARPRPKAVRPKVTRISARA